LKQRAPVSGAFILRRQPALVFSLRWLRFDAGPAPRM
jgi:hypothetical protein